MSNESTIQYTYAGDTRVARVIHYEANSLTLDIDGEQATFQRIDSVPDLENAILGAWVNGDHEAYYNYLEFTPNGWFIGTPDPGLGKYRVISGNTIEIPSFLDEGGELIGTFAIQILAVENDVLTLYLSPGTVIDYKLVPGHSNLAERVVGRWQSGFFSFVEFTEDGQVLYDGSVYNYEIPSDTTILLDLVQNGLNNSLVYVSRGLPW